MEGKNEKIPLNLPLENGGLRGILLRDLENLDFEFV
jgi:hypothetical protein